MIEEVIAQTLEATGHMWRVEGEFIEPSIEDVHEVLDKAAKELYEREIGTRLEIGGIIVDKQENSHSVYVYAGEYK